MKIMQMLVLLLCFSGCKKADEPAPVRGTFSASWVENDTSQTITAKGSLFKPTFKMVVLFSTPTISSTRNITFYMSDTVAGTYDIGLIGTAGKTSVLMNGVNGPEGNFTFNSTSGTLKITEKYPTWISGEFEVMGNPTSGNLEKVKGSFKYLPLR